MSDVRIDIETDAATGGRTETAHDGHNGDGTGTRTTYDPDGNETSVEQLTGLPIPEPVAEPIDPVALLVSALRDPLANLTPSSASTTVRTAILNQRAALDALLAVLEMP